MWRRVNREDLAGSNPLLVDRQLHWPFRWRVYEEYEVVSSAEGQGQPYIQAAKRDDQYAPEWAHVYNPLIDTPYLFLEFARIVEHKDPARALMDWFHKYGLLGITRHNEQYSGPEPWRGTVFPQRYNDDRGGPWDDFETIWMVAHQANESLLLYEAVLGRDEEKLERSLFPEDDPEYAESRQQTIESRAETSGSDRIDALVDEALWQVLEYAVGGIYAYAYPDIAYPHHYLTHEIGDRPPLTIDQLTRSWGARNLIGAMDLQFYWLITSAGELSHCKYCGRIISYAPPIPGSDTARKPRKDKEFCNSRCRQNYHYHTRIKPAHQR